MGEDNDSLEFFHSLASDFDLTTPLRWRFAIGGAPEKLIGQLLRDIYGLGFTQAEPDFDDDDDEVFALWFSEVCVHSADSFAQRLAAVQQIAERDGLELRYYSAELP